MRLKRYRGWPRSDVGWRSKWSDVTREGLLGSGLCGHCPFGSGRKVVQTSVRTNQIRKQAETSAGRELRKGTGKVEVWLSRERQGDRYC